MAEEGVNTGVPVEEKEKTVVSAEEVPMELENPSNATKRGREEDPQEDNNGDGDGPCKKARVDEPSGSQQNGAEKSVEEARLDGMGGGAQEEAENDGGSHKEEEEGEGEGDEENEGDADDGKAEEKKEEEKKKKGPVKLGPKVFNTSLEMYDYFYKLLHSWPLNLNVNKYEHMGLSELLIQGHHESKKKVGPGIETFQIRIHPIFDSRCYFLIRKDGSVDDFSYRKCIDSLLPLPENMKVSKNSNLDKKTGKQSKQGRSGWGGGRGGGGGGWGGGGGRGRGRHGHGHGHGRRHSRN
uniref:Uncharacterized protein n=1 Tax=Araucaria cunninghamii TaxID=56994 RepID=A0A0D6R7G4_ARACU